MFDANDELTTLRQIVADLTGENLELRRQLAEAMKPKANYTVDQFLTHVIAHLGRVYGWKTAYINASRGKDCKRVTHTTIKEWQLINRVPTWAVTQLASMKFSPRPKRKVPQVGWSDDEKQFLVKTHVADPTLSNEALASQCAKEFGREITENAIKGQLDRCRGKQQAPQFEGRRKAKYPPIDSADLTY